MKLITKSSFYIFNKERIIKTEGTKGFFFEQTILIIEADYHYLFNKCHETLRIMNLQIIDIDEGRGILKVCQLIPYSYLNKIFTLQKLSPTQHMTQIATIQVIVEEIKNSNDIYLVRLEYVTDIDLLEKSKLINRFIN